MSAAVALAYTRYPHAFIVGLLSLMLSMQLIGMAMLSLQNKKYFDELFHLGSTLLRERREADLRRRDEVEPPEVIRPGRPATGRAHPRNRMAAPYLITGCAGFLGSNLVGRMLGAGHEVVGVDNLSMGLLDNLAEFSDDERLRFVQADVTDPAALAALGGPFEAVVHLAAFKIPRYGKAIDTLKINYRGTENALELARRLGCKLVLASTSDVYGRNPQLPFSEEGSDHVIGNSKSPRWAYAVSKLFDEHLALAYQDAYGFPVTILRFFGSYGPRQHAQLVGRPAARVHRLRAERQADPDPRRRQPDAQLHLRDRHGGGHLPGDAPRSGERRDHQHRQHAGDHDSRACAPRQAGFRHARRAARSSSSPTPRSPARKYEDVMRRVPDVALCERLLGVRREVDIDDGLARTIEWQRAAVARRAAGEAASPCGSSGMRIGIIGGGLMGLALAERLGSAGHRRHGLTSARSNRAASRPGTISAPSPGTASTVILPSDAPLVGVHAPHRPRRPPALAADADRLLRGPCVPRSRAASTSCAFRCSASGASSGSPRRSSIARGSATGSGSRA